MLTEYPDADADLLTPAEVKRFIDTMLANARFNDEYTACVYDSPEIRQLNPIDRQILGLIYGAKRLRAKLVENDISDVVEEVHELSAELQIPVKRGSTNEKILGRKLLRATADYYEECADRERKERGLPDHSWLKELDLEQLKQRVTQAWQRQLANPTGSDGAVQNLEIPEQKLTETSSGPVNEQLAEGLVKLMSELQRTLAANSGEATPEKKPEAQLDFAFTQFWEDFERHKVGVREWELDTAANARSSQIIFDRICPDITVAQILAEPVALNFKTTLLQLPPNYARGDNKAKSIDQLIEIARGMPVDERMQPGTVNKHLNNLIEYWDCLIILKKIPAHAQNPFRGLHMAKPKGRKAREERHNWSEAMEQKLFSSPLYSGCLSIHRRSKPGTEIHRDALFWMPLLARTMGTRQSETCDAFVRDVCFQKTEEGTIPYLSLLDGKDSGSPRDIPFPDLVLDMGFLEQRVYGRDPNEPLFPELIPQGEANRRSAAFTGKFSQYRQGAGVYQHRVDFHSFRGNVETDLKNAPGIKSAWIDELIGHESIIRRSEGDRYTKKILLPILRRLVNSISIAADFSHLRYVGSRGEPAPNRDQELAHFTALAEREMKKKIR
ncbi:hypothetical protein [Bradyrhizobium sp. CCBAU 21360]|uniref:hypothetical protein n=1 Tax=Bradyrhizobium sp. CCBAU 21360 TaxID=1325081 RepID=UPI002306D03A|nr:hypothetical protein [Bradyrhizobium sp. CCBAU 21360]MDA9452311.1 hypothetical protein [Bradyrhizobium sp. CCBAU 21360]